MTIKTNEFLAGSKLTPLSKLKQYATSKSDSIRRRVASNQNLDLKTLDELSKDESPSVRREIALNPEVTAQLLSRLSHDSSADVRYAIAENIRTPVSILDRISREDSNPYVKLRAKETLKNFQMQLERERNNHNICCHFDNNHEVRVV